MSPTETKPAQGAETKAMKKPKLRASSGVYIGAKLIVQRGEQITESAFGKRCAAAASEQGILK